MFYFFNYISVRIFKLPETKVDEKKSKFKLTGYILTLIHNLAFL